MALDKTIVSSVPYNGTISVIGDVLRRNGADTVVYALEGHTPQLPHTLTVTSKLPAPRKGNAGTTKTQLVFRREVQIDGPEGEKKVVPIISRLETSFPVGVNAADCLKASSGIAAFCVSHPTAFSDLFVQGLMIDLDVTYSDGPLGPLG